MAVRTGGSPIHGTFWAMTAVFFSYYLLLAVVDFVAFQTGLGVWGLLLRYLLWCAAAAAAAVLWWSGQYREHPLDAAVRGTGYWIWLFSGFFLALVSLMLTPQTGQLLPLLVGGAWLLVTLPLPARVLHLGWQVEPQRLFLDVKGKWKEALVFLVVSAVVVLVADHLGSRIATFFSPPLPAALHPWIAAGLTSMGWALVAPRLFQWHQEVVSGSYRFR